MPPLFMDRFSKLIEAACQVATEAAIGCSRAAIPEFNDVPGLSLALNFWTVLLLHENGQVAIINGTTEGEAEIEEGIQAEDLNGHQDKNTVGQQEASTVTLSEEPVQNMEVVPSVVTPKDDTKEDGHEEAQESTLTPEEKEETLEQGNGDQSNEVGFKKVFKFVGFKFTVKKDKAEKSEPVQLLTVKKDEVEVNGTGNHEDQSEDAEEGMLETQETKEDDYQSENANVNTQVTEILEEGPSEKPKTEEGPSEKPKPEEDPSEKPKTEEETEVDKEPTKPPVSPTNPTVIETSSPLKKFFTQGWAGLRKKTSFRKSKEEDHQEVEKQLKSEELEKNEDQTAVNEQGAENKVLANSQSVLEDTPQCGNEESKASVNGKDEPPTEEQSKLQESSSGEPNGNKVEETERADPSVISINEDVENAVKADVETTPSVLELSEQRNETDISEEQITPKVTDVLAITSPLNADELKDTLPAGIADTDSCDAVTKPLDGQPQLASSTECTEVEKSQEAITTEAELLSSQEKAKLQGSPLRKLFSGSGLRKLSGKKHKGKKEDETKVEEITEQVPATSESPEGEGGNSSPSSPEELVETSPTEKLEEPPLATETEGDGTTSDGERKKDGITPWASFKKLVTPKKRVKRLSESDKEEETEKVKSSTMSSTDSAGSVENQDEAKENVEEQKLERSTEESKKKVDSSVSWEALICVGTSKKRARKTSDSDEEEVPKTLEENKKLEEEVEKDKEGESEVPLAGSQEKEELHDSPSPEQASSPTEGEGGSTWQSFKRLVTPRRKSKTRVEDKSEEPIVASSVEQPTSEGEAGKEESWVSLKKLIPGRKKKKSDGKQEQASLSGAGTAKMESETVEDDSDVPAVVPLSEFDAAEQEKLEAQQSGDTCILNDIAVAQAEVPEKPTEELIHAVTVTVVEGERAVTSIEERSPSWISATVTETIEQEKELESQTKETIKTEVTVEETVVFGTISHIPAEKENLINEVELTSEALNALEEAIEYSCTDETTEMLSAVSQLGESLATTDEVTPVPEEEGAQSLDEQKKHTDNILHEAAEKAKLSVETLDSNVSDITNASKNLKFDVEENISEKVVSLQEPQSVFGKIGATENGLDKDLQEMERSACENTSEDLVEECLLINKFTQPIGSTFEKTEVNQDLVITAISNIVKSENTHETEVVSSFAKATVSQEETEGAAVLAKECVPLMAEEKPKEDDLISLKVKVGSTPNLVEQADYSQKAEESASISPEKEAVGSALISSVQQAEECVFISAVDEQFAPVLVEGNASGPTEDTPVSSEDHVEEILILSHLSKEYEPLAAEKEVAEREEVTESVPCVAEEEVAESVSCVAEEEVAESVSCVAEEEVAESVSCVAEVEAAESVPCVAEEAAAESVPCVAEEEAAESVPCVAEQEAAESVPCVAEEEAAESVPCVAEQEAAESVPCVAEEEAAESVPCVAEEEAAESVPCVAEEEAAESVPCVAEEEAAESVTLVAEEEAAESAPLVAEEEVVESAPLVAEEEVVEGAPLVAGEEAAEGAPLVAGEEAAESAPLVAGEEAAESAPLVAGEEAAEGAPLVAGEEAAEGAPLVAGEEAAEGAPLVAGEEEVAEGAPLVAGEEEVAEGAPLVAGEEEVAEGAPLVAGEEEVAEGAPLVAGEEEVAEGAPLVAGEEEVAEGAPLVAGQEEVAEGAPLVAGQEEVAEGAPLVAGQEEVAEGAPLVAGQEEVAEGAPLVAGQEEVAEGAPLVAGQEEVAEGAPLVAGQEEVAEGAPLVAGQEEVAEGAPLVAGEEEVAESAPLAAREMEAAESASPASEEGAAESVQAAVSTPASAEEKQAAESVPATESTHAEAEEEQAAESASTVTEASKVIQEGVATTVEQQAAECALVTEEQVVVAGLISIEESCVTVPQEGDKNEILSVEKEPQFSSAEEHVTACASVLAKQEIPENDLVLPKEDRESVLNLTEEIPKEITLVCAKKPCQQSDNLAEETTPALLEEMAPEGATVSAKEPLEGDMVMPGEEIPVCVNSLTHVPDVIESNLETVPATKDHFLKRADAIMDKGQKGVPDMDTISPSDICEEIKDSEREPSIGNEAEKSKDFKSAAHINSHSTVVEELATVCLEVITTNITKVESSEANTTSVPVTTAAVEEQVLTETVIPIENPTESIQLIQMVDDMAAVTSKDNLASSGALQTVVDSVSQKAAAIVDAAIEAATSCLVVDAATNGEATEETAAAEHWVIASCKEETTVLVERVQDEAQVQSITIDSQSTTVAQNITETVVEKIVCGVKDDYSGSIPDSQTLVDKHAFEDQKYIPVGELCIEGTTNVSVFQEDPQTPSGGSPTEEHCSIPPSTASVQEMIIETACESIKVVNTTFYREHQDAVGVETQKEVFVIRAELETKGNVKDMAVVNPENEAASLLEREKLNEPLPLDTESLQPKDVMEDVTAPTVHRMQSECGTSMPSQRQEETPELSTQEDKQNVES
ncbi:A-kinase anchor protein 12 [Rhinophrynus dorsalis]